MEHEINPENAQGLRPGWWKGREAPSVGRALDNQPTPPVTPNPASSLPPGQEERKKNWTFAEWAESEGWSQDECPESWAQGEKIWEAAWNAHYFHALALEKPMVRQEEGKQLSGETRGGRTDTTSGQLALMLLRHAHCPACDGSGAILIGKFGDVEQCEWCYQRQVILSKHGGEQGAPLILENSIIASLRDKTEQELLALIGQPPEGSEPEEWQPRADTWHQERLNWIDEVARLRAHIAGQTERITLLMELMPTEQTLGEPELQDRLAVEKEESERNTTQDLSR